ncbi:hypothetical protein AGMMS49938_15740 [Fibrobacterales bacterium]|nr:hypothetical protein AGMMS49938_15740 [Fibrobacterales bacterium]
MKWKNRGSEFDGYWEEIKNIKAVYLFGAGISGKTVYEKYKDKINIKGFIDNDPQKQGGKHCGLNVYSLDEILLDKSEAIITTVSSEHTKKIVNQAEKAKYRIYDMHTFLPVYSLYNYDELVVTSISYLPTTVCNLNCKCCLNFAPYLRNKEFRKIAVLKRDIDLFFSKVDFLLLLHISGGEPFLYPNLIELFEYLKIEHGKKIGRLETTTNGTVIPKDELCEVLAKLGVIVTLDDYRDAIPGQADKFDKIKEKFDEFGIVYKIQKAEQWIDLLVLQGKDMSNEQAQLHFEQCNVPWQEYRNGKLYLCNYSDYASVAGLYQTQTDEYFDFNSEFNKKELMEFRLGYSQKGYVDFCKKCAGYFNNPNVVKAAEQM